MSGPPDPADDLLEDAPCGYLTTHPDGTIVRVNRTFERWTGIPRAKLLAGTTFQELLAPGGRIYHETHLAPMLRLQGAVREVAVEVVRADGSRLPALITSVLAGGADGVPELVRTVVFEATDRRRYEETLLRDSRRERATSLELQRSLLAGALPEVEGLELGVSFRSGVQGLEVGGDWYDAIHLPDEGTVTLVVGDVVGRGVAAASTMGQLRSAVRALAATGWGPGQVLEALDGYVRRHGVGEMATVVLGEVGLASGQLRFACAGHPPPLVLGPPGAPARFAWEGRSAPLDAHPEGGAVRPQATLPLATGACVLLYTDGLVERRGRPPDEGLDQLREVVARHDGLAPAELAEAVVQELTDGEPDDDVCLLVARRTG